MKPTCTESCHKALWVCTQTTLYHNDKRMQNKKDQENSLSDLINRGFDEESNSGDKEEEPTRKIVMCPRPVIVASVAPKSTHFLVPNMPNYITQDDTPADNTRSKTRSQETIMRMSDEVMVLCVQMSKKSTISPKAAASRKYPMQLLCKLAGAVLDQDTGDLLEYRHLLKHKKNTVKHGTKVTQRRWTG